MTRKFAMMHLFAGAAMLLLASPLAAMEPYSKKDLDPKNLSRLEEQAQTADDWTNLGQMYERRAEMLEEKAERHKKLEQRYASAPKSLIAKRGRGWNTPKRQAQLALKAGRGAQQAREAAAVHLARAESESIEVD